MRAHAFVLDEQHFQQNRRYYDYCFFHRHHRSSTFRAQDTHTHFFLSRPLFRLVFSSFLCRCRGCLAFHNVSRNVIKLENMQLQFSILSNENVRSSKKSLSIFFFCSFLFQSVDDCSVMVNSLSPLSFSLAFFFCYFSNDVS